MNREHLDTGSEIPGLVCNILKLQPNNNWCDFVSQITSD